MKLKRHDRYPHTEQSDRARKQMRHARFGANGHLLQSHRDRRCRDNNDSSGNRHNRKRRGGRARKVPASRKARPARRQSFKRGGQRLSATRAKRPCLHISATGLEGDKKAEVTSPAAQGGATDWWKKTLCIPQSLSVPSSRPKRLVFRAPFKTHNPTN